MSQKTALYQSHIKYGGKMVDFAGWEMPINYGSQLEEHHQVRQDAGMFDVSHMTVLDLKGDTVIAFLQYLLANDVARLKNQGKALYSCMLNEQGGVIDDLIVYFMANDWFRMVVNAATRDKDIAWITQQASQFGVDVDEKPLAMIAVQGPQARKKAIQALPVDVGQMAADLTRFQGMDSGEWFVGRTGYTGEDGFEIMLPEEEAAALWDALADAGVKPCGLGARDTLRLEAGMNLYGTDMNESTSPLVSGLGWTIAWDPAERNFIGRSALEAEQRAGVAQKLVGLVLAGKGVLRSHQRVIVAGIGEGEVTSGTFSPSLKQAIAMARVPAATSEQCQVEIRDKLLNARVVKPVFFREGKSCIE